MRGAETSTSARSVAAARPTLRRAGASRAPVAVRAVAAKAEGPTLHVKHQARGVAVELWAQSLGRWCHWPCSLTRLPLQVTHSLTPARLEVVRDLDHFAATEARARAASRGAESEPLVAGRRAGRRARCDAPSPAAFPTHRSWWTC